MNIIKYRVWNKTTRTMHPVASIHFGDDGSALTIIIEPAPKGPYHTGLVAGENAVLMQSTGLMDKDGKPIFEDDIVVRDGYIWFDEGEPNYRGTVEWVYSKWQVIAHCVNSKRRGISDGINSGLNDEGWDDGERSDWEVIGNLYETPDLLPASILPDGVGQD